MKAVFCSEGIYSAALIANLGVYSAASSAVYTIMDILPPSLYSCLAVERRTSLGITIFSLLLKRWTRQTP